MPNRILHEKICASDTLAQLSAEEERFFYRLIVKCDDFGRFDGRATVIRSQCFTVQVDSVSDDDIVRWLGALERVGLVVLYEAEGRPFLQVVTWGRHQPTRAKRSRWPDPPPYSPESASTCEQAPADVSVFDIRSSYSNAYPVSDAPHAESGADAPTKPKPEPKVASKSKQATAPPEHLEPTDTEYRLGEAMGLSRGQVDQAAAAMLDHWRAKGERRSDWLASLRTWLRNAAKFDRQQPPGRASPSSQPGHPPSNGAALSRASAQRVSYLKAE